MTSSQTLILTALPNGIGPDNTLKVSVHIAVRLATDNEGVNLSLFQDIVNFTQSAATMSFGVSLNGGPAIPAALDTSAPALSSALWTSIFPSTCPVTPFGVTSIDTYGDRIIRSYPASNVARFTTGLYSSIGLSNPTEHPDTTTLLAQNALGQFASNMAESSDREVKFQKLLDEIELELGHAGGVLPPVPYDPANIGTDIAQVYKFHEPPPVPTTVLPTPKPGLDFHAALGSLGSHPQLLRRLGIIRDLLVTLPTGVGIGHTGRLSVVLTWPSLHFPIYNGSGTAPAQYTRIVSPSTAYNADLGFITQGSPTNSRIAGRRLRLSDPKYSVVDFDVDGVALKTIGLGNAIVHAQAETNPAIPDKYSLPAMRTEGLVLLETGLAATMQGDLAHQEDLHTNYLSAGIAPTFYAEDVVRGYHFDVWDSVTLQWAPLCARHVNYASQPASGPGLVVDVEDEGVVTLAVTSHVPNGDRPDIRVSETLAKWSGWSVVAPRIGAHLDGVDNSVQGPYDPNVATPAGGPSPATALPMHLGITTTIPQSASVPKLPSLRFGRSYKFRARAVDIAGNADAFSAQDATTETTPLYQFSRYEPINSPVILLHDDPAPTESVHRMVIRSNYNVGPGTEQTIRHLAPPNASQLLVEHSGALDSPPTAANPGGKLDPTVWPYLATVDGQKFDSSPLNHKHPDPGSPAPTPSATPTSAGAFVFTDPYVVCPYLTDRFSRGAAVFNLPFGTTNIGGDVLPGGHAQLPWDFAMTAVQPTRSAPGGTFPLALGNRIRLVEGTTTSYAATVTKNTAGNNELKVPLTKGSVVTIRVSSYLTPDAPGKPSVDIDRMGLWQHMKNGVDGAGLTSAQSTTYRALIAAGAHWMFTPYQEIELVHAVQQPLLEPLFLTATGSRPDADGTMVPGTYSNFDALRNPGETRAYLAGSFQVSGRSTSQVQVTASWHEQQDNESDPSGPTNPLYTANPFTVKVDSRSYHIANSSGAPLAVASDTINLGAPVDPTTGVVSGAYAQEFHDHKHRMVTYTLEAMSAFAEEFVVTQTEIFTSLPATVQTGPAELIGGYTKVIDDRGYVYQEDLDYSVNSPNQGDITIHNRGTNGVPLNEDISVSFLRGPISRFSFESGHSTSAVQQAAVVNILATARPVAPHIEYVVPAYLWAGWKTTNTTTQTNKRTGNLLRVYLARPWFSSGDHEKLAVICPIAPTQPDDTSNAQAKISLIGADPVWGTTAWKPTDTTTLKPSGPVQAALTANAATFPRASLTAASGVISPDGVNVGVAVHEVAYDSDRQLWYSDIEVVPKAGAYTPFVRLALARYQGSALVDTSGDLRLSPIVQADIAQLSPDRTLTVTKSATAVAVTIAGTSYQSTGTYGPNLGETSNGYTQAKAGPSIMICKVQVLIPGMHPTAFPDTAWTDYIGPNSQQKMKGTLGTNGASQWTLNPVALPYKLGSQPMRLAFIEYEQVNSASADPMVAGKGRVVFAGTYVL